MQQFYYFNGFNSAVLEDFSGSPKIVAAAEYAHRAGFQFIPYSIDYRQLRSHRDAILKQVSVKTSEIIFCGSSMGGWFARIMQLQLVQRRPRLRVTTIGWNPAYDMGSHGHMLVGPQQNYVTFESYQWTQAHSAVLKDMEEEVDYDKDLPFYVYCDKGDEVIGWEDSAARHKAIANFRAFDGGCHSFDHYAEALIDFNQLYGADKLAAAHANC